MTNFSKYAFIVVVVVNKELKGTSMSPRLSLYKRFIVSGSLVTCLVSVVARFLQEVTFNECVGALTMKLGESCIRSGKQVLELVGVPENLGLYHAFGLNFVSSSLVPFLLLVVFEL